MNRELKTFTIHSQLADKNTHCIRISRELAHNKVEVLIFGELPNYYF